MNQPAIRALSSEHSTAARALVGKQLGGTRYVARLLEQLDGAAAAARSEDDGIVLMRGASLAGLALFGAVAGATGTIKVHLIAGDDADARDVLAVALAQRGDRLVVAEVPDDVVFAPMRLALDRAGFIEEGRVQGWITDGIALLILARRGA